MKDFFTVPSKMKKLAIITLIVGLVIGVLVLAITAISENNDKKRHQNNIVDKVVDGINDYYYDSSNTYRNDVSDKIVNDSGRYLKGTFNAFGSAYRSYHYTPFYFIGGFTIFISVGSAIALIVIAKIKENKLEQVK